MLEKIAEGKIDDVIAAYLSQLEANAGLPLAERTNRGGSGNIRLEKVKISIPAPYNSETLMTGKPARFDFWLSKPTTGRSTHCSFTIYDQYGRPITYFNMAIHDQNDIQDPIDPHRYSCLIDELLLIPGRYRINVGLTQNGKMEDHVEMAAYFDVIQGEIRGRPISEEAGYGDFLLPHKWITP